MNKIFEYKKNKYRLFNFWKKKWFFIVYTKQNKININEGSTCINYSQQCFEGVKCFLKKKKIYFLKIEKNSFRIQKSSKFIQSPIISIFSFLLFIKNLSFLNKKYIPNFKIGFFYFRPLLLGIGNNLGVKSSNKFIFIIFCSYVFYNFKKKKYCKILLNKRVLEILGHYKLGSNYIINIKNFFNSKKYGIIDYIYSSIENVEELGTSNIFFLNKKKIFYCNKKNILPGISKSLILYLYKINYFYLKKKKNNFKFINNISKIYFVGTAVNINFLSGIIYNNKFLNFKKTNEFFIAYFLNKIKKCLQKIKKWFIIIK